MTSDAYGKEQLALLLQGVSKIFDGYILGLVLGIVFVIAYVAVVLSSLGNVESLIHAFGILFIILGLLALPINYYFLYNGFVYLSRADNRYGIGAWGGLGLLVMSGVLIAYGAYLAISRISLLTFLIMSVPIIIAGLIVQVLMYIALYRLGNDFNVDYLIAGIILSLFATVLNVIPIINIVGGILGIVGLVLMLVGLNEVKKKIEARITP